MNLLRTKFCRKAVLLLLEVAILIVFVSIIIYGKRNSDSITISPESVVSDYISYDNGWSVSEGDIDSDESNITLMNCIGINLDKGTYSLLVWYDTENYQNIIPCVEGSSSTYLYWGQGNVYLRDSENFLKYDFETTGPVQNLELHFKYDGNGDYSVKRIDIAENQNSSKRALVYFLLVAVLIDIIVFLKEKILKNIKGYAILFATWFITGIPLFNAACNCGYDYYYHTLRIEAIYNEIQNCNFLFWIESLFFDGGGYASHVFYNDLFMYLPALLRTMGFYVYEACNFYFFYINALTIIIAYFCFRRIFKSDQIGVLTTVVYVTVPYRLMLYYEGSNIGQFTAYSFLPLIALGMWEIYTNTKDYDWKKASLYIILGMSGLIGSHILSTVMACVAIVAVIISCFKSLLNSKVLKTWATSIILTILVNLYFIVPFIDYILNADTVITARVDENIQLIQESGNTIMQFFAFFANPFLSVNTNNQTTPGIVLMGTVFIAIVLWGMNRIQKEQRKLIVLSLLFLWVSTQYFPYNWLAENSVLGSLLAQMQFPDRWLHITSLFLTLLLGSLLTSENEAVLTITNGNSNGFYCAIIGLATIMALIFTSWCAESRDEGHSMPWYGDTEELWWYDVGWAEYVRVGTDQLSLPGDYVFDNFDTYEIISKKGTNIELYCSTGESSGFVEVPLQNYIGYRAWDERGHYFNIVDGSNNRVAFTVPADFEGNITIAFVTPWLWIVAIIISVITIVAVGGYFVLLKSKR